MRIQFASRAFSQYVEWQEADKRIAEKINGLLKECQRTPFTGSGQPEALKHDWAGWWSRRIDKEHRLIYRVVERRGEHVLEIGQCKDHY